MKQQKLPAMRMELNRHLAIKQIEVRDDPTPHPATQSEATLFVELNNHMLANGTNLCIASRTKLKKNQILICAVVRGFEYLGDALSGNLSFEYTYDIKIDMFVASYFHIKICCSFIASN